MDKYIKVLFFLTLLGLGSCTKEEQVTLLQDKYIPDVQDAVPGAAEFTVNLNARALQTGERGEWKILDGAIVDNYVFLEDKNNPFTRFKGLPGEEYNLEWTHWDAAGKVTVLKTKVKIADLNIEINDSKPSNFQTIRTLSVNSKYRGKWSVSPAYGYITTKYSDGHAEAAENKPSIELHAYANTTYTATYTHIYAGREYKFQKLITTGDYTEDDGLYELQLSRGNYRVVEDALGQVLELNLQASGIAWIMKDHNRYPALRAFKNLRRLNLGGSSLAQIPTLFGDHYTDLENLDLDHVGENIVFPENFGNLVKLKTLLVKPARTADFDRVVKLPASFGKLKALESFSVIGAGNIDFNGTLGQLTSLRHLYSQLTEIPDNIGNLKDLQHLNVGCIKTALPQRFAECTSLTFVRINYLYSPTSTITMPARIGDLKQLHTLEMTSVGQLELSPSFSELSALSVLRIGGLRTVPEGFGNLSNLQDLTIHGTFTFLPDSFGKLRSLNFLYLGGKLESLPASFGDLPSLSYLNAEHSSLKTLPESFGKLKSLKELSLRSSKIEYLPQSFAELDGLQKVDLSNSQLKTFPKQIIPLKSVHTVILNVTNTGDIPDDISKMKTGVTFHLAMVPNLTYQHMTYIKSITKGLIFYTDFGYF